MSRLSRLTTAVAVTAALAGTAFAAAHMDKATEAAIKARQGHMQLYSFNLGLLGGMAKGEIDYDADAAKAAASNLASLAALEQSRYWPEGSDNDANFDSTAALPAIWAADSDVMQKAKDLADATMKLQESAGDGVEQLRAGLGPVGGACGACHKKYRQSDS